MSSGICNLCEQNKATYRCPECGVLVCGQCYDNEHGDCPDCDPPTFDQNKGGAMKIKIIPYSAWGDVRYCLQMCIGKHVLEDEGTTYGRKSDARRGARRLIRKIKDGLLYTREGVEVEG